MLLASPPPPSSRLLLPPAEHLQLLRKLLGKLEEFLGDVPALGGGIDSLWSRLRCMQGSNLQSFVSMSMQCNKADLQHRPK